MASWQARSRTRSWTSRFNEVMEVLNLWREGLAVKSAAKMLRKKGIHPWTLAVFAYPEERDELNKHLYLPRGFIEACDLGERGCLTFNNHQEALPLPSGLFLGRLIILGCHQLVSLPRMLSTESLELDGCRRLERLHCRGTDLVRLEARGCPRLVSVDVQVCEVGAVTFADCSSLQLLPGLKRISKLTLKDLPSLRTLQTIREVKNMSLWRLPRLRDLSAVKVTEHLVVQDCVGLQLLPAAILGVRGSVLDCPSLLDQSFAPGPWEFPIESSRDTPAEVPPFPFPPIQNAFPTAFPGLEPGDGEDGWPWPPRGFYRGGLDEGLERASRALGMNHLDRVRLHEAGGMGVVRVVRELMLQERDPADAVRVGAVLLRASLDLGEEQMALQICLEAERLGLGSLSLGLAVRKEGKAINLEPVLGSFWGPRASLNLAPSLSSGHWYHAREVPGPLVLLRPTFISQNTQLMRIDGPLWVDTLLWLSDCPRLVRLPEQIVARSSLTIEFCPRLESFPLSLNVTGDLTLRNLPMLRARECRAIVGGKVVVENCPGLKLILFGKN